jgi:hypothetical protein
VAPYDLPTVLVYSCMVLSDGPAARGAATSWRVYLFWGDEAAFALPLVGIENYHIIQID